MGGGLLQKHDRDSIKFAYKESYTINDRGGVEVYKDPITDHGKKSKRGRLDLIETENGYETVKLEEGQLVHPKTVMRTVYLDGNLLVDDTFENIRSRVNESFKKGDYSPLIFINSN